MFVAVAVAPLYFANVNFVFVRLYGCLFVCSAARSLLFNGIWMTFVFAHKKDLLLVKLAYSMRLKGRYETV